MVLRVVVNLAGNLVNLRLVAHRLVYPCLVPLVAVVRVVHPTLLNRPYPLHTSAVASHLALVPLVPRMPMRCAA